MRILSFDCANRSLAVIFATVNVDIINDIKKAVDRSDVRDLIEKVNRYVIIHFANVFDLTKGKKCKVEERTLLLKNCVCQIDKDIKKFDVPDHVLIEYQMNLNDKSRCVSNQLLYHYSGLEKTKVHIVGPTLKNKVLFADHLSHGSFMEKYARSYDANKSHTKINFLYWLDIHEQSYIVKKIKGKNIDDLADAFMQIFGWIDYSL